jgi:hypothetical protein
MQKHVPENTNLIGQKEGQSKAAPILVFRGHGCQGPVNTLSLAHQMSGRISRSRHESLKHNFLDKCWTQTTSLIQPPPMEHLVRIHLVGTRYSRHRRPWLHCFFYNPPLLCNRSTSPRQTLVPSRLSIYNPISRQSLSLTDVHLLLLDTQLRPLSLLTPGVLRRTLTPHLKFCS